MTEAVEPTGTTMTDRLLTYAERTLPDSPSVGNVLRHYYSHVDETDLEHRRPEDLFGLAMDHVALVERWSPGEVVIELTNPRVELDGWGSDHTVLRIVTEDVPFLVDSVSMELSRLGIGIHQVVHPIIPLGVCRLVGSAGDEPVGVLSDRDVGEDLSLISIEIDRQALDTAGPELEANLRRVIGDVKAAVRDWLPMRDRLRAISDSLADRANGAARWFPEPDVAETRALLDWLADDHFLFLGARDYELTTVDGDEVIRIVPGSGLGILAGDTSLGRPRRLHELAPEAQDRVHERRLLNITKAGTRATVHRASYLDYIGIKTFDGDGNVVGERRFLGLFTSELYNRSVDAVPLVRRLVDEVMTRAGYPAGGHDENRLRSILEQYPREDLLQMQADEMLEVGVAIAGLQERRRVRVFARPELFGRFLTVLVYLPRDRYNTSTRNGIEQLLLDVFGGTLAEWEIQMSESVLARLRVVLRVEDHQGAHNGDEDTRRREPEALEAGVESIIRLWGDDFADALGSHFGAEAALALRRTYGGALARPTRPPSTPGRRRPTSNTSSRSTSPALSSSTSTASPVGLRRRSS